MVIPTGLFGEKVSTLHVMSKFKQFEQFTVLQNQAIVYGMVCVLCYWPFFICQIRNALEKERESTDRERVRHQAKLEEIRDKYESALKQVREELEAERQGHTHLNTSVNKIKKVCKTVSLFCDCSVAVDYFTRKPHGNCYHLLEAKEHSIFMA